MEIFRLGGCFSELRRGANSFVFELTQETQVCSLEEENDEWGDKIESIARQGKCHGHG